MSEVSEPSSLTPRVLRGMGVGGPWIIQVPFNLPAPVGKAQRRICLKQVIEFQHQEGLRDSSDEWLSSFYLHSSRDRELTPFKTPLLFLLYSQNPLLENFYL